MTDNAPKVDPEKIKISREFKHERPLISCHWDPLSRYVFFGAQDNLVHRFELSSGSVTPLKAHDSWIRGFGSSPDGEVLYTAGYDGRLIFWPTTSKKPEPIRVVDGHAGWIRAIAVSPNGKLIATCGNDLVIKLWDSSNGKLIRTFSGHKSHIYNVIFSRDSSSILSCDLKGTVNSWTIESGSKRELLTVKELHGYDTTFRADIGGARDIAWHNDGAQLALSGITKVTNAFAGVGELAIAVVNVADAKLSAILESKDKNTGVAWGVAHHPDGFWIGLTGGRSGGGLYFWREDSKNEFFKLKLKNAGRGMSLSPDRSQIAIAHADQHLRMYSMRG